MPITAKPKVSVSDLVGNPVKGRPATPSPVKPPIAPVVPPAGNTPSGTWGYRPNQGNQINQMYSQAPINQNKFGLGQAPNQNKFGLGQAPNQNKFGLGQAQEVPQAPQVFQQPPMPQMPQVPTQSNTQQTGEEYFNQVPPMPGTYPVQPNGNGYGPRPNFNGYDRPIPDANVPTEVMTGVLDIQPEGNGFLRPKFIPSELDIYISSSQIRKFNLKNGDMVTGQARKPKENERYYGLLKVEKANDVDVDKLGKRPEFSNLTPVYPHDHLKLETGKTPISTRLIDLIAPIGRGQRGMIVSPPKAGKTWLLKEIANGITQNHEDIHLMVVLVGERPEEVTDIARSVKGEVIASNFDEPAENQTRVAEISLDRAKRLVEMGKHVVILLDSITRLARAYNLCIPPSGRTLSGGFDPVALYPPKQFFGAARAFENGGSLTIIGTALVDTGSRMDDLVYEEFKGTGNMELHLDRKLAERRVYPSVDVSKSGTRHEELLFDEKEYTKIITMRRMLEVLSDQERTELLIERLLKTKSNKEFIDSLGR